MLEVSKVYPPDSDRLRLERKYSQLMYEDLSLGRLVSFVGNKTIPLLRLYRYKEAFAFDFVQKMIEYFKLSHEDYIFEPFVGMGTTCFVSMLNKIPSIGIDRLPLATFIARTLPLFLYLRGGELIKQFNRLKEIVKNVEPANIALDVPIIKKAFDDEILTLLRQWKAAIDTLKEPLRSIFNLLFYSILEECSYTSKDGQFLRLKKNKPIKNPEQALHKKVLEAEEDLLKLRTIYGLNDDIKKYIPKIYLADARDLSTVDFDKAPTAIITSPPYPNRYDYTRTYVLELCFGFVKSSKELTLLRHSILRSHIESKLRPGEKCAHPSVMEVIAALEKKDLNNPRIPNMLLAYFNDMRKVIEEWSKVLAPNAKVAMVVDNVRFEGELIPTDLILSEIAEEYGFKVKRIVICRYKGNSSQQMKKYGKVPVRESVVIWELNI